ncbi:MAG TPA: hypothetical protein QF571_02335, partial [Desulfobacterales bacterium]|nr:hypothetical protein [Desulfobacterales bacterium]
MTASDHLVRSVHIGFYICAFFFGFSTATHWRSAVWKERNGFQLRQIDWYNEILYCAMGLENHSE